MALRLSSREELDEKFSTFSIEEAKKKYSSKVKKELETGDLIFFSGNHWLSGLIRWRSKSAWSHVGMVIRIEEIGHTFLIESIMETGVRLIPVSSIYKYYHGDGNPYNGRVAWARYEGITDEQKFELREIAFGLLNKQYDGQEFLRVMVRTIIGREKLFPDNKFTCAELIHHCFLKVKLRLEYDRGLFISPGSVWRNKRVEMKGILL